MKTYAFTTTNGSTVDPAVAVVNGVATVDINLTVTEDGHSQSFMWARAGQAVSAGRLAEARQVALGATALLTGTLTTTLDTVQASAHATRYLPAGATTGTVRGAQNLGTDTVTIAPQGADTIDGGTAPYQLDPGKVIRLQSDGSGSWVEYASSGSGAAAVPDGSITLAKLGADVTSTYAHLLVTDATSSSASGTLTAWHLTPVDATSGAATRTLPAASSVTAGVETAVKKADTSANTVTVSRAGSDLIFGTGSGATSKALTLAGEAVTFVSNGTDRWTIQTSDTPSGILAATYVPLTAHRYPDGATQATVVPRARVKDPRDYGVVMNCATDSTTLTTNTAAFQAFINDVVVNGLEGVMPAGEIRINAQIGVSYRPGWTLRGSGRATTTIKQYTDNVPILNLGSDTASLMHTFVLSSFGLTYNSVQSSANTNAVPILVSQMPFNGRIENLYFLRGYYAVKVASGIGCPWGTSWDDLMFTSGLTGGAMDWSLGANGVPNNHWGRFTVSCDNMTQAAFKGLRGYNFRIDTIEFLSNNNGVALMDFAAGASVSIGTLKMEVATFSAGATLFNFAANNTAEIDEIVIVGSSPFVNNLPGGSSLVVLSAGTSGANGGRVHVGSIVASQFTSKPGTGAAYLVGASPGCPVVVDRVSYGSDWSLTNIGGTASADVVTVTNYINGRASQDKGDADYTVTLGDPNVAVFNTTFTAARNINLPSTNGDLFNGLFYEFIFNGAVNGSNTAAVKCGATTLATITMDGMVARFTYRRHASSAASGWALTRLVPLSAQLWATPATSTTLTGTLAAWTVTAVDCTAGAGARTLPAASSVTAGTAVCAKKADTSANALVVSRAGSDLIFGTGSGSTSKTLTLAGEAVEFVSNGVDKWTVRASDTPSGVLATTYVPLSSLPETITYNGDGTVATVTETGSGAVVTYTYNADGTPATETRLLSGVSTVRTFSYSGGNLVGVS